MTYLEVHFVAGHREVDFLLENIAFPIQPDCLAPVIKRPCDEHLVGIVRPGFENKGRGQRAMVDSWVKAS